MDAIGLSTHPGTGVNVASGRMWKPAEFYNPKGIAKNLSKLPVVLKEVTLQIAVKGALWSSETQITGS